MFTVKWIAGNGSEVLYADAREVSYTPGEKGAHGDGDRPAKVSFYFTDQQSQTPGDSFCVIEMGHVYVMNERGRTVADYLLSTKEFPHGLAPRQE